MSEHLRVFLFQATRELLLNAVKHSRQTEARIGLASAAGIVIVQVEDSGRGFDSAAVEAGLQRPKSLGLFGIRERVEALGGRLEIQSTPQGGGCFRLLVPLAEQAESPPADDQGTRIEKDTGQEAPTSRGRGGAFRLLVVDDHAVVREGFVGLLNRQDDLSVVGEAVDGRQAIVQAQALQPDVILMDVDMPLMDGVEATRRIKRCAPKTAIVGLSIHQDESVARAMVQAGADAYVSKHARAQDIIETVRRVCQRLGGSP